MTTSAPAAGANLPQTLGWRLSKHARDVIARRGFRTMDALLAAADPEVAYTSYNYGPGRRIHQRGHVAVAVEATTQTIITVLLRAEEVWTDTDAAALNATRNAG